MRLPDFAGTWYPGDRQGCLRMIDEFERELGEEPSPAASITAIMVPHAGWVFSGATAWAAMRRAASAAVERIVIFGGHLASGETPRLEASDAWRTPIRDVEIDGAAVARLRDGAIFEIESDRGHQRDNGIELVLALAAAAWPNAGLVAIGAPPTNEAIALGRIVGAALGGSARTIFVASTDLTHYGPAYGFTPRGVGTAALDWARHENDADFVRAACGADPAGILTSAARRRNACCPGAVAAAWSAAGVARGALVRYASSHDRGGGLPEDFVGYAAVTAAS